MGSSTTPDRLIGAVAQQAFDSPVVGRQELVAGAPEPVVGLDGSLDYWLVAGYRDGLVLAVARVLPDGQLATVGGLRAPADDAAHAVTGLSSAGARRRAAQLGPDGGSVAEPVLVHDGPRGREAWLLTLTAADGSSRHVFATGAGEYEQRAGPA